MATITKRKNGWNVQIRRNCYASRNRTFPTKSAASAWAREQEGLIDQGRLPVTEAPLKQSTLSQLIDRYLRDVIPTKRSSVTEDLRLRRMQRNPVATLRLDELKPAHFATYRDDRLKVAKPGTVRREMYLLAGVIDIATKDWGFPFMANPARKISFPIANDARDRRLETGEAEKLHKALSTNRNPFVRPIVLLAIETGLRRREVLELTWGNVDLERRIAHTPVTKTGVPRTIPLTDKAIAIVTALLPKEAEGGAKVAADALLFPITLNAFKQSWKHVQQRAGLANFRFHDLRHEALSRFCELGLSVPELAVISGHKDPGMLFRYTHLRADDLARKLAGRQWEDREVAFG